MDSPIFIKWATARRQLSLEEAICGYTLYQVQQGEKAITSTLVKDEVLIWLSRYRASRLERFLRSLRALASLKIVPPSPEHEKEAVKMFGSAPSALAT